MHAILPMDGPLPESPRFAEGLGRPAAVHVWRRGMPLDMQALSKLVIWTVRAGIRARRVVEAARRREA